MPGIDPPADAEEESFVFAFFERRLLVYLDEGRARVPTLAEVEAGGEVSVVRRQYLGALGKRAVFSVELAGGDAAPRGMALEGLRSLFELLEEEHFWIASRAVQVVDWDRDHQFCGRCATPTEPQLGERARKCPRCGLSAYPRLAPAVIVLVERGDELLLARSPHFLPGMYSTLAGFVEPGESLEETVAREIEEEVGVRVANLRYFGSQPWPFPNSLMIGFRVDWTGGEIVVDRTEIEDADWFHYDALPRIPHRISIARALIESYLAERRG